MNTEGALHARCGPSVAHRAPAACLRGHVAVRRLDGRLGQQGGAQQARDGPQQCSPLHRSPARLVHPGVSCARPSPFPPLILTCLRDPVVHACPLVQCPPCVVLRCVSVLGSAQALARLPAESLALVGLLFRYALHCFSSLLLPGSPFVFVIQPQFFGAGPSATMIRCSALLNVFASNKLFFNSRRWAVAQVHSIHRNGWAEEPPVGAAKHLLSAALPSSPRSASSP